TQVLGLIVGGAETSAGGAEISAGGAAIGVAPQARWIAARVFDDRGRASAGAVHLAFQWLLDPDGDPATPDAPQVVNASWAFGAPGCNLEFQPDLQALQAAGITAVFAAGNYGPEPASSPSPANYPEALAVGAVDHYDLPYLYSSRGPAECGGTRPAFPDLVAPGVDLRTTDLSGLYTTASGTSLAAPHAAGGLALLLSHFPTLTLADRRQALLAGTYPLSETIPDPSFGYGRLDLLAAYRWVQNTARYPAPPIPRLYLPLIEK
ncbi:MAG: S8 family serine peptidase, partial [Chloroflexota bacterium]